MIQQNVLAGKKKKNYPGLWEYKYSQEIMEVIIPPPQSEHFRSYLAVAIGLIQDTDHRERVQAIGMRGGQVWD